MSCEMGRDSDELRDRQRLGRDTDELRDRQRLR